MKDNSLVEFWVNNNTQVKLITINGYQLICRIMQVNDTTMVVQLADGKTAVLNNAAVSTIYEN